MSRILTHWEIIPRRFEPGLTESESAVLPLKERTDQVLEIDFFDANGRETVDGLLAGLEDTFKEVSVIARTGWSPAPAPNRCSSVACRLE
jgi:hypothetical protein